MDYSEDALQKVREDRMLIEEVDDWVYELIEPFIGQRVLEIGCGLGNFTRRLSNRELYIGTDVSTECVNYIKDNFEGYTNIRAYAVNVADESVLRLSHYSIDTVFSLNVFEHIADDWTAMKNVARILQPGGVAILVVPAHNLLYGNMDKPIGHYRRYSKEMLTNLSSSVGLTCVTSQYVNFVGAIGWFVNGRLLRRQTPPSDQLRLFNKLTPILKKVERYVPVPFGNSLLHVSRK